jgi:hypothetical protein
MYDRRALSDERKKLQHDLEGQYQTNVKKNSAIFIENSNSLQDEVGVIKNHFEVAKNKLRQKKEKYKATLKECHQ